jgi:hypothetical protein
VCTFLHLEMSMQAPLVMSTPNTNQFNQTYSVTTPDFTNNNEFTKSKICHVATIPPTFCHTWSYVMNGFSCAYCKITTSLLNVSVRRPNLATNNYNKVLSISDQKWKVIVYNNLSKLSICMTKFVTNWSHRSTKNIPNAIGNAVSVLPLKHCECPSINHNILCCC